MIPDTVHDIVCPTCKQKLIFKLTEDILVPVRFEIPLRLRDGHEIRLDTTHYVENPQRVCQVMLVIVTYCPGDNK